MKKVENLEEQKKVDETELITLSETTKNNIKALQEEAEKINVQFKSDITNLNSKLNLILSTVINTLGFTGEYELTESLDLRKK